MFKSTTGDVVTEKVATAVFFFSYANPSLCGGVKSEKCEGCGMFSCTCFVYTFTGSRDAPGLEGLFLLLVW